jgi:hypothetical protein
MVYMRQLQVLIVAMSSLMMCLSAEDLKKQAHWDGAQGHSRQQLLSELSSSWTHGFTRACLYNWFLTLAQSLFPHQS